MNIRRLCLAALPIAASLTVGAAALPAAALSNCVRVDGSQHTSGQCTGAGGTAFMYAEQVCVLNYYTYVTQDGPHVGQNGYSSTPACTSPIVNRKLVQTNVP